MWAVARGAGGRGASRSGNFFAVAPERQREDAVALYASWLQSQPQLLEALGELRRVQLLRHCAPHLACRADVLLAGLAKRDGVEWRDADVARGLATGLATARRRNGADLRTDGSSEPLS